MNIKEKYGVPSYLMAEMIQYKDKGQSFEQIMSNIDNLNPIYRIGILEHKEAVQEILDNTSIAELPQVRYRVNTMVDDVVKSVALYINQQTHQLVDKLTSHQADAKLFETLDEAMPYVNKYEGAFEEVFLPPAKG